MKPTLSPTPNIPIKAAANDRAQRMYSSTNIYTPLPNPAAVDDAAIRRFHDDGFIAVENVLSPAEVRRYLRVVHQTILADDGSLGVTHYEPGVDPKLLTNDQRVLAVRKLFTFVEKVPALGESAKNPNVLDICQKLVGESIVLLQDMALLKPPGGGAEKPWHQDTAYFKVTPPQSVIGAWIALDEATVDNGCMHCIPGTHHLGPTPHYHDLDCQIPDDKIDVRRDIAVPLKPGGAMFFSGLLHHGTPPNLSSSRRQALQYHYCTTTAAEMSRDQLEEMFRDRAGFAGCQGWSLGISTRPMADRAAEV